MFEAALIKKRESCLELLRKAVCVVESCSISDPYPLEELKWLFATVWNLACETSR